HCEDCTSAHSDVNPLRAPTAIFASPLYGLLMAGRLTRPCRIVAKERQMQANPRIALMAGAVCMALAGCASTPPPKEQMAVGRKAVERASGTPEVVALAPVEIDRARAKIAAAERAMARKDYVEARR